ncbi:MAG: MBL fold metallo-hydrolase [Anaerolineaceae bacterium]|nr:MBL fold metallo-hydrolase [Anaerolineaceae bacterium]
MPLNILQITVPFMPGTSVNCYLVAVVEGFVLVDSGTARQRNRIEDALHKAGCHPGNLNLIVLTHGDFDHCANAAYFAKTYRAPIVMHAADRGMVQDGDMLFGRKQPNIVMKTLIGLLMRLHPDNRFTPDAFIKEGDSLTEYGFDAQVIEIPGHSSGSVGLLAATGDFFCGDLLANTKQPDVWSIIDDEAAAQASVKKLAAYPITTVYPGHGNPFDMQVFWELHP